MLIRFQGALRSMRSLPSSNWISVVPKSSRADVLEEIFGEDHHVVVVPIGGIGLEHGEFRIVGAIDPFIAKDFADFKDAIHAADNQLF